MIPEWSTTAGFQVKLVEQGKAHLTTPETLFTPPPTSFRPAQWIVEYQWHSSPVYRPLKLSASICYDATDLALASDLKARNDVYIVCALNQDVGTFDRMVVSSYMSSHPSIADSSDHLEIRCLGMSLERISRLRMADSGNR